MNSYLSLYPLVDDVRVKESVARALGRTFMQEVGKAAPYSPVAGFLRGLLKRRGAGVRGRLDSARLGASEARLARRKRTLRKRKDQSRRAEALTDIAKQERDALSRLGGKKAGGGKRGRNDRSENKRGGGGKGRDDRRRDGQGGGNKSDRKGGDRKGGGKKGKGRDEKPTAFQQFLGASKRVAKENPLATATGLGLAGLGLGHAIGDSSDDRRRMVIL